nr:protein FAM172A isoform X2 [Pelodiscus sinensis]|eukprot:XP_014426797.1 protein FAM172A isoform X2 [Pelodiscus sinensis]
MSFSFITLILLTIWINMAQLQQGGPDEKEKTTALKDLLSRIDLDELMKKDEPPLEFPDTLEGFEYAFNEQGQLRHIKTGEPFVFNYREDLHRWNQKRYEALGEIITRYVYELLEKECNLKKVTLPSLLWDEDEGFSMQTALGREDYSSLFSLAAWDKVRSHLSLSGAYPQLGQDQILLPSVLPSQSKECCKLCFPLAP